MRRVVRADTGRDGLHDDVVVWAEEKRDRVARGASAVEDTVRRRAETVVRVARQHCPGIDDEGPGHRRWPNPFALGSAHFETRQRRLCQEGQEIVIGMRREAELVLLRLRMRRVMNEPDRAVRLGERLVK